MHELGIVMHIVHTLEDVAAENNLHKIGSVTLEVGEVSGVIHDQLLDAWDYFRKKSALVDGAELKLEVLPAITYCSACERTYETVRYGRTCPYCGSGETWLEKGNECNITEIEAE